MVLEGKLIGSRYEIIEKVGNGGMATVYRATDKVLKRQVAVKILRDEYTTDEEFIKRFEGEAQSAAKLSHSNIVSIYDVGVDGNLYYIVMELIEGKTLKELIIEERGPLPWKWSVNIAVQIALALEAAHRNNIVHRDIKPHNIIITEDGIAKVTDFGIAKAVSNSTITAFGTTIGSVHYFSPEHAKGGYTDAKSDIYSLGVVMYEMLAGRVPFDADTPVSVALKHMQEEPEPPIEINPNIPVAINKIILKAMQKDVNLRYQSSTEIIRDLRASLKDEKGDFVKNVDYTARTQKLDLEDDDSEEYQHENKFKSFIKKHKIISTIVIIILLFAISLGGTLAVLNITNPSEVQLPKLIEMSKDDAQKIIDDNKLVMEVQSEEYNKDIPEGIIISQNPEYKEKYNIKEGSIIKVVVSKGAEKSIVPKVIGDKKEDAIEELETAKFKVEIEEITSKTVEEGYVVEQSVEADTEAFAGDTIKISVSKGTGIKQITVPSVVTLDEETAKKTLLDKGFVVNIVPDQDDSRNNGVVLKQSLDVGTVVDEGSEITITVNKKPKLKTGTVYVNLKSILKYTPKKEEVLDEEGNKTGEETVVKETAKVRIMVAGEKEYEQTVDKNTTNISQEFSAKGDVTIEVFIDDALGGRRKTINMDETTTVTFE